MPTQAEATPAKARQRALAERVLGPARSAVRALAMGGWTAGVTEAAVLYLTLRRPPARERVTLAQQWVQRWARGLLAVFGIQQFWVGPAVAAPRRARLIVANHRSPVDIILMLQRFGGSVLARHDLEHWPILGRAAREGATMFVDRNDPRSGVKAIREIRRRLAAGQTVIVFPEGTTHRGDEVRPFQGGAFAALRGLDVEVLPVGIAYDPGSEFVDESFVQHVSRMAQRPRTRVALCAGEIREAHGDREALALAMQQDVQALVERARAALPPRS